MENKKKVQDSLNRSLSGLCENPYLAQRVIAQAKGETKVKRKSIGALTLAIVLALALMGTAYALFSSKVAEFFGAQYGQEMSDWLQAGKIAQMSETLTFDDVMITLDEVVYRNRGIYGVGTIRAVDPNDVLIPDDYADPMEMEFSACTEAQALVKLARAQGGRLLTVNIFPYKIGVDDGAMLPPGSAGYFDIRNDDGSLTFSFDVEGGYALEEGQTYQLVLNAYTKEIDFAGQPVKGHEDSWAVSFLPVIMAESIETAPVVTQYAADGYEIAVPAAYNENGTMPVYRAVLSNLTSIVQPEWFNQSGIAEKRSESSFVFADHAVLSFTDEYLRYEQFTDEIYDYATLQRTFDPNAEPDLMPIPDLSSFVMTMADGVHNGFPYGEGVQFEKDQLSYLSLTEAKQTADEMVNKFGLNDYTCSYVLDMSAERISTLGEKYNQFWYESEMARNNNPRMDYSLASVDDEGYYLVYSLTGMTEAEYGQQMIAMYIDRGGIAYMTIRNSFTMADVLDTPDSLISPDVAIATLTAEAAASLYGKPVLSVHKVSLVYRAVRADNKADGMAFTPVWLIEYKDAESAANEHDFSQCEINAVNGKLINASFR